MVIQSHDLISLINELEKGTKMNLGKAKDYVMTNELCYDSSFNDTINLNGYLEKSELFRKFLKIKSNGEDVDTTLIKSIKLDRTRKKLIFTSIYDKEIKIDSEVDITVSINEMPLLLFLKYLN